MKPLQKFGIALWAMLLSGCVSNIVDGMNTWDGWLGGKDKEAKAEQSARIDEVPMYGGMDRSKYPELKKADEEFIAGVTKAFGSREVGAMRLVDQGFAFYKEDKLGMAMRRFNQAWLLNPQNADVFTGFANVLNDQGKYCEANEMMEKSFTLVPPIAMNPPEAYFALQGTYPDASLVMTRCAVSNKALTPAEKKQWFDRAERLFEKQDRLLPAKDGFRKAYLYETWAKAYYLQEQYEKAWAMVKKQRDLGREPMKKFLDILREKMPEPAH